MVAISSNVDENSLDFEKYINTGIVIEGDFSANHSVSYDNISVNKRISYLKIVCAITSSNTSLDSIYTPKFRVMIRLHYTKASVKDQVFMCYPNFNFETNYNNYFIVELSGDKVASVDIQITNNYSSVVTITDFKLYYIKQVTEDDIQEIIKETYIENPNDFNETMEQYFNENPLSIPYVSSLPPASSVPAGYICRLF